MATIVAYDVPSKHDDLKKALFELEYKDRIPGSSCKVIYFPNTTLYHSTKTAEQAREDVKSACKRLSISLDRCVATKWIDWAAICGEPFKR